MNKKGLPSIVSHAVVALAISAMSLMKPANAAVWQGGDSGDIDNADNWNGDVTTSAMAFSGDAYLTLGQDYSVYQVFGTSGNNRYVTIDLSGHALGTTSTASSNRDFWRASSTTICITNSSSTSATFTQKSDIQLDNPDYSGTTLIVSGENTVMNGTLFNRGGNRFSLCVLDGATFSGATIALSKNYSTNLVANGATLDGTTRVNLAAGNSYKAHDSYNGAWHDDMLVVSNATLSGKSLFVAHGQLSTTGAPYNNTFVAQDQAEVAFTNAYLACGSAASNNVFQIADSGTTFSVTDLKFGTRTGGNDSTYYATLPAMNNEFTIENGATANVKNTYIGAGGNVMRILSGATYNGTASGVVQLNSDMTDTLIENAGGRIGSRLEVVGGTLHYLNSLRIGSSNEPYEHVVLIGEGGVLKEKPVCFMGSEATLFVSNGTVNVTGLNMRYLGYGSNNTVRVMGENASVTASDIALANAAAVFEFVIPEDGWSVAPVRVQNDFTIPADFKLNLDEDALKAYKAKLRAANQSRGTVPLMRALSSAVREITVDDMDALSANLPEGCSLVNESGVLSVVVSSGNGFIIIVR